VGIHRDNGSSLNVREEGERWGQWCGGTWNSESGFSEVGVISNKLRIEVGMASGIYIDK
jgi:hypothetical protein